MLCPYYYCCCCFSSFTRLPFYQKIWGSQFYILSLGIKLSSYGSVRWPSGDYDCYGGIKISEISIIISFPLSLPYNYNPAPAVAVYIHATKEAWRILLNVSEATCYLYDSFQCVPQLVYEVSLCGLLFLMWLAAYGQISLSCIAEVKRS